MPLQAPPPPPPAIERAAEQAVLMQSLLRLARDAPQAAFEQAVALHQEARRDRVRRAAFLEAASRHRELAARWLPEVGERPWVAEVSLFDAAALAGVVSGEEAERLLRAVVQRNPSLALREMKLYERFEFGQAIFEEAVAGAPDEAAALASGNSPLSQALREKLRSSEKVELRRLAEIAAREGIDESTRARMAALHRLIAQGALTVEQAADVARDLSRYFGALVDLRLKAKDSEARSLDRILEGQALILCRAYQEGRGASELQAFSARDLFLMLAYGRAEHDDTFFTRIFDRILAPKLHGRMLRVLDETGNLRLRALIATSLYFGRFEQLLALAGAETAKAEVVKRVMRRIESTERPLEEAVIAAEIIEGTFNQARIGIMGDFVLEEYERVRRRGDVEGTAIYGTLAGLLVRKLDRPGAKLVEVGRLYQPYLREIRMLDTSTLFDRSGLCVQRHFFYNDPDGVESFESFLATYRASPRWRIENHGDWVHLKGKGARGRRIEIFANVPVDLLDRRNRHLENEVSGRQAAVSRILHEGGRTPVVFVHRGHAYHVDSTMDYLTPSAQFVFLGSCRGLGKVHAVMETAPSAHVIVSRSTGTLSVNDPLLKDFNDRLLDGAETLDWAEFWKAQSDRLGARGVFADYVAPHRNPASIFLRAYYSAVEEAGRRDSGTPQRLE